MSRCFPFPPPGYEKRLRNSEQESLLSKEKHKEKKHKKEKKDKDRVENKERNDIGSSRDKHSDGSRDKHKKKKDKKEKHKDKKRKTEDNIGSSSNPSNETLVANETKDSKFREELGRRIRDEEKGAANCMAKNISNTTNGKIENNATGTSTAVKNDIFTTIKTVANGSVSMHRKINKPVPPFHQSRTDGSEIPSTINEKQKTASRYNLQQFNSLERRNDKNALPFLHNRTEGIETPAGIENQINGGNEKSLTPPNDKHTPLFHNRRTEGIETLTSIDKQKIGGSEKKLTPPMLKNFNDINKRKVQINQKAGNFATEDRRNHVTIRPFDEFPSQKGENVYAVNSNQKNRNSNMASNANGLSTKSNNELEQLVESITSIPESTSSAQATEKERCLFPNFIHTEAEKKNKRKELENAKTEGSHKDRDGNEKNKKEKDKEKEKKREEKKKMKMEQKHANHVKLRDIGMKDLINDSNGKSIASPRSVNLNAISADGPNKKRKEFEMNGLLYEPQLDERPNKLPRPDASYSDQLMKNGKTIELNHVASKLGSTDNITIKKGMENNGNSTNGKAKTELQASHIPKPPITPITLDPKKTCVVIEPGKKDRIRTRPPHRDAKYLDTIYSVPKLEEIPEPNERSWLLSEMKRAAKTNLEANESPPKVWAQGLRIEEADVFALPYVVPF